MRRVIINVGVGAWYPLGQQRLADSLTPERRAGADIMFWKDWPPFAVPHSVMPFQFKSIAFKLARASGYESIIWLDCSCWAVRSLEPLFAEIEAKGAAMMMNGYAIGNWASDYCLEMFGWTRDYAMTVGDIDSKMLAICLHHDNARAWLDDFIHHCRNPRLVNGSLKNVHGEHVIDPHSGYDCGVISADQRCYGHAREQTVAGILTRIHGLDPLIPPPRFIQRIPPETEPHPTACIQAWGI